MSGSYGPQTGPLTDAQAREWLERASEAAGTGDYGAASGLFARLTGHPDPLVHVAALLGLADARYRLDDDEGALQAWLSATQAPENALTWRAWVQLAGARVRQGDLAGATRSYREAERRAPAEERPAIASRLGWLNKEMGDTGSAQRYFGRARAATTFTPLVTYAILGTTVAISLAALLVPPTSELAYGLLPLDKRAVLAGEWWRLVTVTLVHAPGVPMGFIHLGFNMYFLYIVGPIVEAMYGRALMAFFYVVTAICGSLASFLVSPTTSVGASGAIFGLLGLLAVSNYIHKPALGWRAGALASQIGFLIVLNIVIGFTFPGIDNAAHLGGLAAGAWLGLVVVPRGAATLADFWRRVPTPAAQAPARGWHPMLQVAGVLALGLAILLALSITPFWLGGPR
ncbi:MAG TPA: rhomboid family intramembrane serine protease [Candidatus Limnocylindrales bacterium]|jgi:membrane associated rhomboid family serine protease|nr:rhomboid family intramembrane serine protease [Candidatus Limnocylindrales bacterium]